MLYLVQHYGKDPLVQHNQIQMPELKLAGKDTTPARLPPSIPGNSAKKAASSKGVVSPVR